MGLAPLKPFGLRKIAAVTLQAISGAGYPGHAAVDIVANVIPFIKNEEEKVESETQKILGDYAGGKIDDLAAVVSAQCNRVQVVDGHTVCVSVELADEPSLDDLKAAFTAFRGLPQQKKLPTAPKQPIHLLDGENRPQPRRDALREGGMAVSVGRVRACPLLGYKFVCLGHNTIRGAAGAAVLNAELMYSEGWLD
jgi:aspartate-semialdehyde dehydrogenase